MPRAFQASVQWLPVHKGLLGLCPGPCVPDEIRLGCRACLCLSYAFNCFECCQLEAVGDEIWGRGWGSFPMWLPLFTSMGENRLRGVEVGKIFHYIKRTKEETASQWPLARPQECTNPGNWPLARLLRGCWLGKTGSLSAAKNADNGLLDILLLKVRLLFYYHQR